MLHPRLVASGLVLCALVSPAVAEDDVFLLPEPDPELGGIGMALSISRASAHKPEILKMYFARLDADGNPASDEVIESSFCNEGQQYLLNVPPGTYAAVGVSVREFLPATGPPTNPDGTLRLGMGAGEDVFYSAVFSDELIANTKAAVVAGRITFAGKFKTRNRMDPPDRLQRQFVPFLEPPIEGGDDAPKGVTTLRLKKVYRDRFEAERFWKKARDLVFAAQYPWIKVVEAEGARVEP